MVWVRKCAQRKVLWGPESVRLRGRSVDDWRRNRLTIDNLEFRISGEGNARDECARKVLSRRRRVVINDPFNEFLPLRREIRRTDDVIIAAGSAAEIRVARGRNIR